MYMVDRICEIVNTMKVLAGTFKKLFFFERWGQIINSRV